MKNCLLISFLLILSGSLFSQKFEIVSYQKTPESFLHLLKNNDEISKNDTLNELLVDMVQPTLADSMIYRKKQHHKLGPIGFLISTFGNFNWRAFSMKKEKFVGTVVRTSRSGEEQYTEYDVNFDLNFHLHKYLHRVFEMYDRQGKIKRQDFTSKRKIDFKASPFVRDTNNIDIRSYRLHCELTPQREYRAIMNYFFLPTLPGAGGLKQHVNLENDLTTMGFYGLLCLDCNHSCHPEMHPYEWIWWLKANDGDNSTQKEWHIGLFHEGSNRMKKWSKNPKNGTIKIPFAFKSNQAASIEIQHGAVNEFVSDAKLMAPENVFKSQAKQMNLVLKGRDFSKIIALKFVNPINTQGLSYWFSDLNYDADNGIISGYFNYAICVKDLYSCKIVFDTDKE
jgi:hypothetical protein